MSWWNAKYKNNCGEYEITFGSKEYEKTKAVEKVCRAVMDETVNTPDDIEIVVRGRWIDKGAYVTTAYGSLDVYTCSNCNMEITIDNFCNNYCPNCGAKMDLE